MLRVAMNLKMKRKISRGRPMLRSLDNTDTHMKGNSTSLKEDPGKKCFEKRQDRKSPTDKSSGDNS